MSDVTISFHNGTRDIGQITSSLECFDSSKHVIPKRILNKIRNSNIESIELSFEILKSSIPEVIDKNKLLQWIYENGYFSLTSANMIADEIEKGTFNL